MTISSGAQTRRPADALIVDLPAFTLIINNFRRFRISEIGWSSQYPAAVAM
jgi:hypothetical protein